MINKKNILVISSVLSSTAFAVPADWSGTLALDTNIINDVRRTNDDCTVADGSQCIADEESNARFQSMILKLNPTFVVNDGVSLKGELSTSTTTGRTTRLGEGTTYNNNTASTFSQSSSSSLNINQVYAEIYADTALYRVGRFAKHYGLGAVINSGSNPWDRFYTAYEGVEANLKLGNFKLSPMWAKLHTSKSPNGKYDSYETSLSAVYDDSNKNFKFGVYYGVREVETQDELIGKGSQNINIIDVYVQKAWENFEIGLEVPMLTGEISNTYNTTDADFDANAYILQTKYNLNSKWMLGFDAGMVKGDDASSSSFEGMYLHPNFQVGELMFKYNFNAFNDSTKDVFNSSIVNATYAKLAANYSTDEWTWKFSALWAVANEVAEEGKEFYDHNVMKKVTANADQSKDLGYELGVAFDYQWNPNVVFSSHLAYHMVGDYYAFINDANNELETANVMSTGMKLSVNF